MVMKQAQHLRIKVSPSLAVSGQKVLNTANFLTQNYFTSSFRSVYTNTGQGLPFQQHLLLEVFKCIFVLVSYRFKQNSFHED
jgi:hypothetical protein